ncbi:MAG: hypothetical protein JW883_15840 [Deltaproteobacteria bacterium]|nr:hypothetical protein [Deltaproteobacteria bacterium]
MYRRPVNKEAKNQTILFLLTIDRLLADKRRIILEPVHEKGIGKLLQELPLVEAVINHEVVTQSRFIDLSHQDPAE